MNPSLLITKGFLLELVYEDNCEGMDWNGQTQLHLENGCWNGDTGDDYGDDILITQWYAICVSACLHVSYAAVTQISGIISWKLST